MLLPTDIPIGWLTHLLNLDVGLLSLISLSSFDAAVGFYFIENNAAKSVTNRLQSLLNKIKGIAGNIRTLMLEK